MSANNSFKQLMEQEEKEYPHAPPEIEKEVTGSMRMMSFVGEIVELYLPRIFDLFFSMLGGKATESPEKVEKGESESDSDDSPEGRIV